MSHTYISFIPTWEWSHFHIGFSTINYSSFVLISVPPWAFSCLVALWLQFSLSKRGHCGWGQTAVSHCKLSVSPRSCSNPSLPMNTATGSLFLRASTWNTVLAMTDSRLAALFLETTHAVLCRTVYIILNPWEKSMMLWTFQQYWPNTFVFLSMASLYVFLFSYVSKYIKYMYFYLLIYLFV